MRVEIKKKQELENAVGKVLAKTLLSLVGAGYRRVPSWVSFHEQKPKLMPDDGDTVHAYAVDMQSGEVLAKEYCGSGNNTINFMRQQLSEGQQVPENFLLVFVTGYHRSGNRGWYVDIVSSNLTKQIT